MSSNAERLLRAQHAQQLELLNGLLETCGTRESELRAKYFPDGALTAVMSDEQGLRHNAIVIGSRGGFRYRASPIANVRAGTITYGVVVTTPGLTFPREYYANRAAVIDWATDHHAVVASCLARRNVDDDALDVIKAMYIGALGYTAVMPVTIGDTVSLYGVSDIEEVMISDELKRAAFDAGRDDGSIIAPHHMTYGEVSAMILDNKTGDRAQ